MSFFFGSAKKQKPAEAPSAHLPVRPGTPLELVRHDTDNGKFEISPEALQVLRGIKGPVGVVSVCGRARQVGTFHPTADSANTVFPCLVRSYMWPLICKEALRSSAQTVTPASLHSTTSACTACPTAADSIHSLIENLTTSIMGLCSSRPGQVLHPEPAARTEQRFHGGTHAPPLHQGALDVVHARGSAAPLTAASIIW